MPDHTTKGETPFATVNLNPNDIPRRERAFLKQWAKKLDVTEEVLLKRILIAALEGSQYAEKIPEI
jgi:hypothetical protein